MIEIERKFLVKNVDFIEKSIKGKKLIQGYLNTHPERTIRIRIADEKAFITIKGKANASGTTRLEWEKEIPKCEAEQLLPLCEPFLIEKIRYEVPFGGNVFEVDVFEGNHKGLILAEIELPNENMLFEKPHWLGQEVTGDKRYYNSFLSKNIFSD